MRVWIALACAALASPSLAQTKGGPLPPDTTEAGAEAWVKRYIEEGDFVYIGTGNEKAYLIQRSSIKATTDGTIKFWVKGEYFKPSFENDLWVRSELALWEADCDRDRLRLWASDTFTSANLLGERISDDVDEPTWMANRPDSVGEYMHGEVCDYVRGLLKQAEAKKAEPEFGVWKPAVQPK